MQLIKEIKTIPDGYEITYVTDESTTETVKYTKDEFTKMKALMTKAEIEGIGVVMSPEDPALIKKKESLNTLRNTIIEDVKDHTANIERDYKDLSDTVTRSIATKNQLWTQLHQETESHLGILIKQLTETKLLEESALRTINRGEAIRSKAITDVQSKTDLAWIDVQKSSTDVANKAKDFEAFKNNLDITLGGIKKTYSEAQTAAIKKTDEEWAKITKELEDSKKEVKSFVKRNDEKIAKRNEILKKTDQIKLQKAYIAKEVKLGLANADKMHEYTIKTIKKTIAHLEQVTAKVNKQLTDKEKLIIKLETELSAKKEEALVKLTQSKADAVAAAKAIEMEKVEEVKVAEETTKEEVEGTLTASIEYIKNSTAVTKVMKTLNDIKDRSAKVIDKVKNLRKDIKATEKSWLDETEKPATEEPKADKK